MTDKFLLKYKGRGEGQVNPLPGKTILKKLSLIKVKSLTNETTCYKNLENVNCISLF